MTAAAIEPRERMTILLSRRLRDGWTVVTGMRSLVPLAASLLARATHAPNLTLVSGGIYVNPHSLVPLGAGLDCRPEAVGDLFDIYQQTERGVDAIFHSGMQIDRFANVNLHWVKRSRGWLRGPGVANTSFGHTASRTLLWLERHEKRLLPSDVDFASIVGLRHRGRTREELGLPNLGPALLVTPAAVFEPVDGQLRAREIAGDRDWQEVRDATGWELPEMSPPASAEPDEGELTVLRGAVDPGGLLRRAAT